MFSNKMKIRLANLRKFRSEARSKGLSKRNVRPHTMRLYAKFSASENTLLFNLDKKINSNIHQLSNGLDERDAFIADSMGLGIHPSKFMNGNEYLANCHPVFYPEPTIFNGPANPDATEAQSLEMLYNALMQIESNQDIRLQDYDTAVFRTVPETQEGAGGTPLFQYDYDRICKSLETSIAFAGGDTNLIQIKMRGGDYGAIEGIANARTNYAIIFLDGLVIKNGAQKATRGEMFKALS